jgi:ADP-dependent phosphofructokinase/glucokinase
VAPAGRPYGGDRPAPRLPHYILEFTAGTPWGAGTVARSTRIIVRFAEDGIERDGEFAAAAPELAGAAGAGLVSGLNGVPDRDRASRDWLRSVVTGWRDAGLASIHLELAEYVRPAALVELTTEYAGLVSSVGMSLSELRSFSAGDPAEAAVRIAERYRLARVLVHADEWSLAVHRGDPEPAAAAVRLGNLLAAARAAHGSPTGSLAPPPEARFATDYPASGPLGGGWRVSCAPSPYLPRPATTIGLGDSFVAGALLADCLRLRRAPRSQPPTHRMEHPT